MLIHLYDEINTNVEIKKFLPALFLKILYGPNEKLTLEDKKKYTIVVCDNNLEKLKQSLQYVDYLQAKELTFTRLYLLQQNFVCSQTLHSVIVFDLDDTLIHEDDNTTTTNTNNNIINNDTTSLNKDIHEIKTYKNRKIEFVDIVKIVNFARCIFDKVILWSHGTTKHVYKMLNLGKYTNVFDLIISRDNAMPTDICPNKGIGFVLKQMNIHFKTTRITKACLVDNEISNFNNDYDFFIHVTKFSTELIMNRLREINTQMYGVNVL